MKSQSAVNKKKVWDSCEKYRDGKKLSHKQRHVFVRCIKLSKLKMGLQCSQICFLHNATKAILLHFQVVVLIIYHTTYVNLLKTGSWSNTSPEF